MIKIQQNTLYGEAAARIRDMINDGTLLPGTRIPENNYASSSGFLERRFAKRSRYWRPRGWSNSCPTGERVSCG